MGWVDFAVFHNMVAQPFIINHVANESASKMQNIRNKRIGVMKGAFDYAVKWKGGYGEMEAKLEKGIFGSTRKTYLSPEQKKYKRRLDEMDIPSCVFRTEEEFLGTLLEWGLLKPEIKQLLERNDIYV
ncbi:MAG: hypothetical protein MI745_14140 [Pseudomonadales bacterium]|nr:hypothetical protein [Pseudomonadales bacterium]